MWRVGCLCQSLRKLKDSVFELMLVCARVALVGAGLNTEDGGGSRDPQDTNNGSRDQKDTNTEGTVRRDDQDATKTKFGAQGARHACAHAPCDAVTRFDEISAVRGALGRFQVVCLLTLDLGYTWPSVYCASCGVERGM